MRRAAGLFGLAALALLTLILVHPLTAQDVRRDVLAASFAEPTERYDHGILGDAIEYGALILDIDLCPACANLRRQKITIRLPDNRVFEDLKPRLADLDGDGLNEVIVVETSLSKGASLAVYGPHGKIAATPFLGRPYRWLAPIGAADLNGDGHLEIAYIEKPHLSKILKIWRLKNGKLRLISQLKGLTNHKIGDDFISGGIRDCGKGNEIITADRNWQNVIATRLQDQTLTSRILGLFKGQASLKDALLCKSL